MNRTSCPPNAYCLREEFISQRLMCYVVVTKKNPQISVAYSKGLFSFMLTSSAAHLVCSLHSRTQAKGAASTYASEAKEERKQGKKRHAVQLKVMFPSRWLKSVMWQSLMGKGHERPPAGKYCRSYGCKRGCLTLLQEGQYVIGNNNAVYHREINSRTHNALCVGYVRFMYSRLYGE